jgi:hypothetical protein
MRRCANTLTVLGKYGTILLIRRAAAALRTAANPQAADNQRETELHGVLADIAHVDRPPFTLYINRLPNKLPFRRALSA